jgi:hypothetical protein
MIYCSECGEECVVTQNGRDEAVTACCESFTVFEKKCSTCEDTCVDEESYDINGENYCCESAASKYLKDNL